MPTNLLKDSVNLVITGDIVSTIGLMKLSVIAFFASPIVTKNWAIAPSSPSGSGTINPASKSFMNFSLANLISAPEPSIYFAITLALTPNCAERSPATPSIPAPPAASTVSNSFADLIAASIMSAILSPRLASNCAIVTLLSSASLSNPLIRVAFSDCVA